jgi:hypothetical protein
MTEMDEHYAFTMEWIQQEGHRYGRIHCKDKKEMKAAQDYYRQRMSEEGKIDLYDRIEWKLK